MQQDINKPLLEHPLVYRQKIVQGIHDVYDASQRAQKKRKHLLIFSSGAHAFLIYLQTALRDYNHVFWRL